MTMTFHYGSGSPFAWRVWLALEHKRLAYDFRLMSFSSGDLRTDEYAQLNPRRKVPVLVDNGFVLYESAAIVEYLEDAYPLSGEGRLFPEHPRERAIVRRVILEADQYLSPGVRPMLHEVFFKPEAERDPTVIQRGRDVLAEELSHFERITRGPFLLGALTAADFTLYPMLAITLRLEQRFGVPGIRSAIGPKLQNSMAQVEALPYFAKTIPPHWNVN